MSISVKFNRKTMKGIVNKFLSLALQKRCRYGYARLLGLFRVAYFPAANALDEKLLKYLGDRERGTFIEAGANDGISQSNTWYLERYKNWRGVLVEPVPTMAKLCNRFRLSPVENIALGEMKDTGSTITLYYGALMTVAADATQNRLHGGSSLQHATEGAAWNSEQVYEFQCKVTTVSDLIEKHNLGRVNLLSLDVEGYELKVLRGVDFSKHCIEFILIETNQIDFVVAELKNTHRLVEQFSFHDYLFRAI
jgi:FkbM family methyltransferase